MARQAKKDNGQAVSVGTEESRYNNFPVLSVMNADGYSIISFGVKKARAILEQMDAIKAFVEKNTGK